MNHPNVLLTPTSELTTFDFAEFRHQLEQHFHAGHRLLSLFGSPAKEPAKLDSMHAVFIDGNRKLNHFRGRNMGGKPYLPLTQSYPAFHCFEREVHEQYGIPMPGHPWLKPIRFEGQHLKQMNDYPFFKLDGKEVHEVGVGPIHAGVIEPGHFRFMCFGEKVHHLEIHLGYQHRGAERLLLNTSPRKLSPLIESIAGDTSVAYTVGFCRAWEALCGLTTPPEVDAVRCLGLELERIAMHLVGLAGLATDVAYLPGSSTYGRLRTSIINLSMRLCGSRFGRSWFRPGELRFACRQVHKDDVRKTLTQVRGDIAIINELFKNSKTVQHRLQTTGTVSTELAQEIGLVGIAGRSSGLKCDLRTELQGGTYERFPITLITESDGDCWSRGMLRIREIDASIAWIMQLIETMSEVDVGERVEYTPRPNCSVVSFEEGWRGEVMHSIETDGNGLIVHYKIQDPSLRNWFGLAQAVKDNAIYDFPICNKSFDLSYCGNDL